MRNAHEFASDVASTHNAGQLSTSVKMEVGECLGPRCRN
jgi:hypothetical protein